jgi:hypothetical protein
MLLLVLLLLVLQQVELEVIRLAYSKIAAETSLAVKPERRCIYAGRV